MSYIPTSDRLKRVLIITNPLNHEGGVVNYYRILMSRFRSEKVELVHHTFGSRMELFYSPWKKRVLYPIFYFFDYLRLIWRLSTDWRIRIIQISPSLIPVPLLRDAFILIGAKLFHRHVIVFYRGWKEDIVHSLKKKFLFRLLFRFIYGRADVTIVLASRFKEDLVEMDWPPCAIQVTTTMYKADETLSAIDRTGKRPRFLFLGRISELKGIGELIDASKLLDKKGFNFECVMVGHGDREGVVDTYASRVREYGLESRFRFTGRLTGRDKFKAYADSDIYVFPSWTEGCPTSVLEALGSGLFVISTEVGALKDIIRENENGRFVRCKDPKRLAEIMAWTCENIDDIRKRRAAIQQEAAARYEAGIVVKQFEKLYERLINA